MAMTVGNGRDSAANQRTCSPIHLIILMHVPRLSPPLPLLVLIALDLGLEPPPLHVLSVSVHIILLLLSQAQAHALISSTPHGLDDPCESQREERTGIIQRYPCGALFPYRQLRINSPSSFRPRPFPICNGKNISAWHQKFLILVTGDTLVMRESPRMPQWLHACMPHRPSHLL